MSQQKNRFVNFQKMAASGEASWTSARLDGLIDLAVEHSGSGFLNHGAHQFLNMCSCSYLGLDIDRRILEGAKHGIDSAGTLHLTTARVRIYLNLLEKLERDLSEHYNCTAMSYNSCAAATSACLPLLASGLLTGGVRPVLAVDKCSHFSINHVMAICGDETEVVTCPHNDVQFVEDLCRKYPKVAFVGDGTYSMGGHAPVSELIRLQSKYDLFLYLDDSHGLSTTHPLGWGYVRGMLNNLNDRTAIVGSLAKAFGACGGILMFGKIGMRDLLIRYGNSWSQYLNSAGIGGVSASLGIHQTDELGLLQGRLWANVELFDRLVDPVDRGAKSPIRLIPIETPELASQIGRRIYKRGFYTSPVFFPIVPRGTAGLRVMLRADISPDQIACFSATLKEEINQC